jgi:hypothetical protein
MGRLFLAVPAAFGAVLGLTALAGPARGYDAMVQATVSSQSYQVRDAGDRALTLSRLDTYLRLFILDILPAKKRKNGREPTQMHFVASMRLRADFGGYTRDWDRSFDVHGADGGFSPVFELLYAHLAVTDIAGFIDLKVGRQFHLDPMDFYGFDGLHLRFKTPFYVAFELIGGRRQSGLYNSYFADAPIFLLQGSDNTESKLGWMPMVGIAAETSGLSFLRLRVAYRTVWHIIDPGDPGFIYPDGLGDDLPKSALNAEKLSAHATATFWKQRLQVHGGVRYNLLTLRLDEAQGGVGFRYGPARVRAEYVIDSPDFDGDSIFNIFNTQAYQEVRLWYEHRFNARWAAYARITARLFEGGASDAPEQTERRLVEPDIGGGVGATYLGMRQTARLDLYWQEGYGGRTLGLYGYYRYQVVPRWLALEGRAVVAYWDDDLSTTPEGVSAGVSLGARLQLSQLVAVHVLVENNFGTYNKSDLRVYGLLNFAWCTYRACPAGEVVP